MKYWLGNFVVHFQLISDLPIALSLLFGQDKLSYFDVPWSVRPANVHCACGYSGITIHVS